MILGLTIASIVLVLDQLSKWWMMEHVLKEMALISYAPFFNLVRAWNTGVSFSMFNNWGIYGVVALSAVALLIVGMLVWWLKSEQSRILQVSIGFIIGGAIGNVIDRIRFRAVFDFLDFSWNGNHWPAFNVADSFICVGAAIIIIHSILVKPKKIGE